MNVVSQITSYQRRIEKSTDDVPRILHCIEKLYKLPVTVQHLQETGVGKTVNALRKYDGTVGDAAKALVAKWKTMVADEESSGGDDDDDNGTHDNQEKYSDNSDSGVDKDADSKKSKRSHHSTSEPREKENRNSSRHESSRHESSRHESSRHTNKQSSSEHSKSRDNKKKLETDNNNDRSKSSRHSSSELKHSRKDKEHKESSRDKKTSSSSSSKDDRHKEKSSSKKNDIDLNNKKNYDNDNKDIVNGNNDKYKKYKNDSPTQLVSEKKKRKNISSDDSDNDDGDNDNNTSSCDLKNKKIKTESYDSQITSKYRENNETTSTTTTTSKDTYKKDKSYKEKDKHKHKSSSSSSSSSSSTTKIDNKESKSSKLNNKNDEKIKDKKSHNNKDNDKYKSNNKDDDKDKKDKKKSKKKYNGDGGIDCNSGASFAEALGMCTKPSKNKKITMSASASPSTSFINNKIIKTEPGTSSSSTSSQLDIKSPPSSSSSSLLHGKIKVKTDLLSKDEPLLLLSPNVKLPPLVSSVDLAATLPETNPNYKPLPTNYMNIMNREEESKALGKVIYAKNTRTKVYSGNKTGYTSVPSLQDICIRILIENIDALEVTGGVPYDILKPVLERATVDQLYMLEQHNPYLLEDTDILWKFHCNKEFRNKERKEEELESWRNMYMRCLDERDEKLKRLTENINKSKEKSLPVRSTKLAYVDNIVKPPRNILKKQARYGTSSSDSASDIKKKLLLGGANSATNISVSVPSLSRIKTSSSIVKKNKAPLMVKALQLIKGRYKR